LALRLVGLVLARAITPESRLRVGRRCACRDPRAADDGPSRAGRRVVALCRSIERRIHTRRQPVALREATHPRLQPARKGNTGERRRTIGRRLSLYGYRSLVEGRQSGEGRL